jgi:hypothetical protein
MALGLAVFVVVYRAVARWRPVDPGPPLQT